MNMVFLTAVVSLNLLLLDGKGAGELWHPCLHFDTTEEITDFPANGFPISRL
jgi:hypothetical protein